MGKPPLMLIETELLSIVKHEYQIRSAKMHDLIYQARLMMNFQCVKKSFREEKSIELERSDIFSDAGHPV